MAHTSRSKDFLQPSYLKTVARTGIGTGFAITLGMMVYAAQSVTGLLNGLTLWAVLPYLLLLASEKFSRTGGQLLATVLAAWISAAAAGFMFFDALFIHISSTGALVFLGVPFFQCVLSVLLFIILLSVDSKAPLQIIGAGILGGILPILLSYGLFWLSPENYEEAPEWLIYVMAFKFFAIPLLSCLGAWMAYQRSACVSPRSK